MKAFIDCGSNVGISFNKHKRRLNGYEFFLFEPNPNINIKYKDKVHFYNKAVWINNSKTNLYLGGKPNGIFQDGGSTIVVGKNNIRYDNSVLVDTIDFSSWVLDTFNINDYIYLHMDIEGSEYEVLNKMFNDGSIKYINRIKIEFHKDRFDSMNYKHKQIIKKITGMYILIRKGRNMEYKIKNKI